MNKLKVNNLNLFFYGIMALPIAMAGIPLYIHAPDFYVKEHSLNLTIIGGILLLLRIIDAILDPLIGILSDKYRKFQKEIFITGAILLGYGFYLLFNPYSENLVLWFTITVFLASTGFSIVSINLVALGAVWSGEYNEKTKISSFREGFGLLGLIIAVSLPTIIASINEENTFRYFSIIMVGVLLLCTFIFLCFWLYKFDFVGNTTEKFFFSDFLSSLRSKYKFFIIYFISILSSSIPAVLVMLFIRDRLDLEKYTGIFLLAYFLSAALSMFLWNKLSSRKGKLKTWLIAMMLAVITFIWAFFVGEKYFYPYLIICILSGFAFGAELALPPAILADMINKNNYVTDYSVLAFLSKMALALSVGFALPLLEYYGFKTNAENSEQSLFVLSFLYALLPCVIKLISAFLLFKFLINGEKNEKTINNLGGANA